MAKDVAVSFDGEMTELRQDLSKMRGTIESWGSTIKGIGVAAFAGWISSELLGKMGEFIGLANEQIEAETKLASVLNATGNAAGFTSGELQQIASDLQSITTFGDESIINMQAVLATFKEIKGDEFNRATKAALDMSAVLGTDLQGAAVQVGKALNDPIKGITALSRSGVSFTEEQKKVIESLQETGEMAKAQNIILAEMEAQFGGAAEAAANTAGGGMKQLANTIGDIQENAGRLLLGVMEPFLPLMKDLASVGNEWSGSLEDIGKTIGGVLVGEVQRIGAEMMIWWEVGSNVLGGLNDLVGDLATAFGVEFDEASGFALDAFNFIREQGVAALTAVQIATRMPGEAFEVLWASAQLGAVTFFEDLKHFFTDTGPELFRFFHDNWRDLFTDAQNVLQTILENMAENLVEFFKSVAGWMRGEGFDFEWTGLTEGFESSLKELPDIAEREMTDLEKKLSGRMTEAAGAMSEAFAEQFRKNLDAMGLGGNPTGGGGDTASGAAGAGAAGRAGGRVSRGGGSQPDPDVSPLLSGAGDETAARIEGLGALFSRIQSSAAGPGGKAELEVAKEGVEEQKQSGDKLGELVKLTKDHHVELMRQIAKINVGWR